MFEVNAHAVLRLTRAALPGMVQRRSGAIINVSSVAAWVPRGSYAASKAYVLSAQPQCGDRGCPVRRRRPGPVPRLTHTEFHARSGNDAEQRTPGFLWLSPERVVDESLAALGRGRTVCIPEPAVAADHRRHPGGSGPAEAWPSPSGVSPRRRWRTAASDRRRRAPSARGGSPGVDRQLGRDVGDHVTERVRVDGVADRQVRARSSGTGRRRARTRATAAGRPWSAGRTGRPGSGASHSVCGNRWMSVSETSKAGRRRRGRPGRLLVPRSAGRAGSTGRAR